MSARVTLDDIAFALDWIESYDATGPSDEANGQAKRRVIAWLEAELRHRAEASAIRKVAKDRGVSVKSVRRAVASQKRRTEAK